MVTLNRAAGVPLVELRAAVALARATPAGGVVWTAEQWERLWVLLTPPQQSVVYLVVLVGLTQHQAAEQLGVSRGAVAASWRRALDRIRDDVPRDN